MLSRNPISNISYHKPDELRALLSCLVQEERIDGALWISHRAESDTKKDHIHLLIIPAGQIDTSRHLTILSDGCSPVWQRTRKVTDWILYAVHDLAYLESKGLTKQFTYSLEDIQATDARILEQYLEDVPDVRPAVYRHCAAFARSGKSIESLLVSGLIPLPYFRQAIMLYDIYMQANQSKPLAGAAERSGAGAANGLAEGGAKGGGTPVALAGNDGVPPPPYSKNEHAATTNSGIKKTQKVIQKKSKPPFHSARK